jgi:outer membrane immunogenic protein
MLAMSVLPASADFAGPYIGSHIGGNFPDIDVTGDFDNGPPLTAYSLEPDDWTAGVQVGFNLPYAGLVFGIEAAASFGSEVDTRNVVTAGSGDAGDDFASYAFEDTITLAARAGILLHQRYMPFVKVGVAWADVKGRAGDTDGDPPVLDAADLTSINGWETGYVVGGGIEFLWARDWSIRAEYEYMDFGDFRTGNGDGDTITHDITNQTVKVGVSYHF